MNQRAVDVSKEISGPAKAAAFLLLVGPESAKRLAVYFSEEELRAVFDAADSISSLSVAELEALSREFREKFVESGFVKTPGLVESIFTGMRPEMNFGGTKGSGGDEPETVPDDAPIPELDWQVPQEAGDERIIAFLEAEHPQAGAFLLSKLEGTFAARILDRIGSDLRRELALRLADLSVLESPLAAELAGLVHRELSSEEESDSLDDDEVRDFAGIVNQLSEEVAEEVLSYLSARNKRKAEIVRKWMFRFEAVETLSHEARAILCDRFSAEELATALSGTPEGLKEAVFAVLSQRNRRSVEAELQGSSFPQERIAEARVAVVNMALKLSHEGVIALEPGDLEPPQTPDED